MISKKYLGLFAIICTIVMGTPGILNANATFGDDMFKYRKCLFDGQFWNLFCPSNPDNKKNPEVCLVYDKNCVFVKDDSYFHPQMKCIQIDPNREFCYVSVKPAPPNCIWIDKDNEVCSNYKP